MADEDIPKTAVATHFDLFEFVRMSFGLRNAPQAFQRFIDQELKGLSSVYAYIVDILVATDVEEEHSEQLNILSKRLHDHKISIDGSKSILCVPNIEIVGHEISEAGITSLPINDPAIQNFPQPTSQCKVREWAL